MSKGINKEKVKNSGVVEGAAQVNEKELVDEMEQTEESAVKAEESKLKEEEEHMSDEESSKAEENEVEKLKSELTEAKDKYLRLYSEFENYRRRTAKERLELIKTANEDLIVALLPVMDDFQRAQKALEESADHKASKEGFDLIYNKFSKVLKQNGLKPMENKPGQEFNTDHHEAISQMPVEKKNMKGKIIDVVENGYYLDEKVIRFAKVVIGA